MISISFEVLRIMSVMSFFLIFQDLEDDDLDISYFYINGGATYFQKNRKESFLFGDFYMKIIGEITEGGFWVCVFAAKVLGRLVER